MVRALITLFVALAATGARAVDVGDPMPAVQSGQWLNSAPLARNRLTGTHLII